MTTYDDFDELASAYLDGEATAEEVARVESDPELLAIVEEFGAIAGAVSQPVAPVDEATRDAQIAAAIGAAGGSDTDRGNNDGATVSSLAAAAEARARRAELRQRVLSVAAVIAAVAVGGAIIFGIARSTTSDTASDVVDTTTDAASESAEAVGDAAEESFAADDEEEAMEEEAMEEVEEAREEDAMEEEAMAEEEPAAEAATEPSAATDETSADDEEARLGDDDAEDTTQGAAELLPIDLDGLLLAQRESANGENASGDDSDADASDGAGLFALPLGDRLDFMGVATSPEELADMALAADPSTERSPLGGDGCIPTATRLQLAQSVTLVGTAQLIDAVTGQPADLAVLVLETDGDRRAVAIDINECRVYVGADDVP